MVNRSLIAMVAILLALNPVAGKPAAGAPAVLPKPGGGAAAIWASSAPCLTPDTYEGAGGGARDDTRASASTITTGGQPGHTFDVYGDADWATFVSQPGYLYTIYTANLTPTFDLSGFYADTLLELYAAEWTTPVDSNDDYAGSYDSRVQFRATGALTYYLRVRNFNPSVYGCNVGYDLVFVATPPALNLDIAKSAVDVNGGSLNEGDEIAYTITVINNYSTTLTNVVITDAVPLSTTFVAGSAQASQGALSGPNPLVARLGSLAPGQMATLTFQVSVDQGAAGQTIQNTATASSDQTQTPVQAGPVAPQPGGGLVQPRALDIVKTAQDVNGGLLFGGDEVAYWITVTNLLTTTQTDIRIIDSLPTGTSFVAGSAQVNAGTVSGPDPLVAAIDALPAGDQAILTFRVLVNDDAAGQVILNSASATSDQQTTPVTAGPVAPQPGGGLVQSPRLQVSKTAWDMNGGPLYAGDTIQYQIGVRNIYTAAQTNVILADAAPPSTTYVPGSASVNLGMLTRENPPQATIATLQVGQIATLTFQVTVDAGSDGAVITNTGQAMSDQQTSWVNSPPVEPAPSGGLVHSGQQQFALTKTALDTNGGYLLEGDDVVFIIGVTNLMTVTQTGIIITDAIPAYTTYVDGSLTVTMGTAQQYDPIVVAFDPLPPGGVVTASFHVRVNAGSAGQVVSNTVIGTSDAQQTTVIAGPVEPQPGGGFVYPHGLDIAKQAIDLNGGALYEGDTISYTVVVTNILPDPQTGVTIVDPIPGGATLVSGTVETSQGSVSVTSSPDAVVIDVGTLQAGASATLTFQVRVNYGAAGQVVANTAQATSSVQTMPVIAGPVQPQPSGGLVYVGPQKLGITKMATEFGLLCNGFIHYTVVVQSLVTNTQLDVVITDVLPSGAVYVPGTASVTQGALSDTEPLIAAVCTLLPSQTVTFTFQVQVTSAPGEIVTNTAMASSDAQVQPVVSLPTRTRVPYRILLPIIQVPRAPYRILLPIIQAPRMPYRIHLPIIQAPRVSYRIHLPIIQFQ